MNTSLIIDDELRSLLPELSAEENDQLEQNLLNETKPESIVILTWHSVIVDGYKLYEICQKHNIRFTVIEKEFADIDDAKIFRIETHLGRRHFNNYVRARLVLELEELYSKRGLQNKRQAIKQADLYNPRKVDSICQNSDTTNIVPVIPVDTKRELAKLANVSHDTIARVKKIEEKASPEQKQKLESGAASINKIYNEIVTQDAKTVTQKKIKSDKIKTAADAWEESRKSREIILQELNKNKLNLQDLHFIHMLVEGLEEKLKEKNKEQQTDPLSDFVKAQPEPPEEPTPS